ncbi:MAG: BamA/TamA family outer membrane protein [Bacteroidia bacterium]
MVIPFLGRLHLDQRVKLTLFSLIALIFFNGCTTIRFVDEDKLLLKKDPKVAGNKALSADEVLAVTRTKANRKMFLGPKTFLYLYNLGRILQEDEKILRLKQPIMRFEGVQLINDSLAKVLTKDVGEPPVTLDTASLKKDSAAIYKLYYANGFLHPQISDSIKHIDNLFETQKALVTFHIKEGTAYQIEGSDYSITSPIVKGIYEKEKEKSLIKNGERYKHSTFEGERGRITQSMRNNGFFAFAPDFISYLVDTSDLKQTVPDVRNIKVSTLIVGEPKQYKIREVALTINSSSSDAGDFFAQFRTDTLTEKGLDFYRIAPNRFIERKPMKLKVFIDLLNELNFDFICRKITVKEGDLYSLEEQIKTQKALQALTMFQFVTISFLPNEEKSTLDMLITIKLAPRYEFKYGAEIFGLVGNDNNAYGVTSNLPAFGLNASLRNRNAFGHSEQFESSIGGLVSAYRAQGDIWYAYYELRGKLNLEFPRLITPFSKINRKDLSPLSPKTGISGSFRVENRVEYERYTFSISPINYRWNTKSFRTLENIQLSLLSLDFVAVANVNSAFQELLNKFPQTQRDFASRFLSRDVIFTYTHSNYTETRKKATHFLKITAEEGGIVPFVIDWATSFIQCPTCDNNFKDHYLLGNRDQQQRIDYGQYWKLSAEGKYHYPLWKTGALVGRTFLGASGTMGYSYTAQLVPYQVRFFAGGPNSMRGWLSNTLGPGTTNLLASSSQDSLNALPGGEYMFELNAELRFNTFSYIQPSIFTDIGNLWFTNKDFVKRQSLLGEKAVLDRNNFVLGWDIGTGLRMDFSFLIFRLDFAQQMYRPAVKAFLWQPSRFFGEGDRFTRYSQIQVGIGYPF